MGEQGIGWACPGACTDPGGGRGSGPHRKITRYMGRSRTKPPHTPDETVTDYGAIFFLPITDFWPKLY